MRNLIGGLNATLAIINCIDYAKGQNQLLNGIMAILCGTSAIVLLNNKKEKNNA